MSSKCTCTCSVMRITNTQNPNIIFKNYIQAWKSSLLDISRILFWIFQLTCWSYDIHVLVLWRTLKSNLSPLYLYNIYINCFASVSEKITNSMSIFKMTICFAKEFVGTYKSLTQVFSINESFLLNKAAFEYWQKFRFPL